MAEAAMIAIRLRAEDVHAAVARLVDTVRVAGVPLARLVAEEDGGGYEVAVWLATGDREAVELIAARVARLHAVDEVVVEAMPASAAGVAVAAGAAR